mgnify:CR=1 FL=1
MATNCLTYLTWHKLFPVTVHADPCRHVNIDEVGVNITHVFVFVFVNRVDLCKAVTYKMYTLPAVLVHVHHLTKVYYERAFNRLIQELHTSHTAC